MPYIAASGTVAVAEFAAVGVAEGVDVGGDWELVGGEVLSELDGELAEDKVGGDVIGVGEL